MEADAKNLLGNNYYFWYSQPEECKDEDIKDFQPKINDFFVTYVEISGTSKVGITKLYTYVGKFPYNFLLQVFPAGMWKLEWKDEAYFFNHSQCGSNSENKVAEKSQSYLKTVYGFPTGSLWMCGVAE